MFKNNIITDPMMFPFIVTQPTGNQFQDDEDKHETIYNEDSFLPESIYSSFAKTEHIEAKSINPNEILVTYNSREKTNDEPVITKSEKVIITPRNSRNSNKTSSKTPVKGYAKDSNKKLMTKKKKPAIKNNDKKKKTRGNKR